jgi:hypothetical protein
MSLWKGLFISGVVVAVVGLKLVTPTAAGDSPQR